MTPRNTAAALDWDAPPAKPRLPLRLRAWGFCLSRAEWTHRRVKRWCRIVRVATRQLLRTRHGWALFSFVVAVWGWWAVLRLAGV